MITTEFFSTPGEHRFTFQGETGTLEGVGVVPENAHPFHIAMLGHPHSLQGGSMSNKVVTTLARAFRDAGVTSLRFNFRGVGQSQGEYNQGIGESEDMVKLMNQIETMKSEVNWILAGFSFGSYVTYRAALSKTPLFLLSIAPPIERYDYTENPTCPWVIIQGDADEVVHAPGVFDFAAQHHPPLKVIRFEETGHFFHGKLLRLREVVQDLYHEFR